MLKPPLDNERWQSRAESLYADARYVERCCDCCGKPYKGPAVYCSLKCALEDV